MPGVVSSYVAKQPPVFRGADAGKLAARQLAEKVINLEYRYRLGGRSLFPPWLDRLNCRPWELRRHLRSLLADSVIKPSLLSKVYAVSALDAQMAPPSERPIDQTASELALYAYTVAIDGGIPKMAQTYLLHKYIFGETVFEMVWHKDLWSRGAWAGRRFFRDFKARDGAEAKFDRFGNLESVVGKTDDGEQKEWTAGDGLEDFIAAKHLPLFDGPGQSDLLAACQLAWDRHVLQTLRNIYLEKFVGSFVVAKYGQDADRTVTVIDPDTKQELPMEDVLEPVVEGVKARGWAVLPPGVTMETLQLATESESEFQAAIDKNDEKIALSITGAFLQMLTSQGIGVNMRGSSETQRSTSELFAWAGMVEFCAAVNSRMTPRLIQENFGTAADYPLLTLGGINPGEAKATADLYAVAVTSGVRPSRKAFASATGVQLATTPDDELLAPTVSPLPPGTPGTVSTPPAPIGGIVARPVAANLPAGSTDAAAATGDVQGTALNGAQVASLLEIVGQVAQKQLPITTAKALVAEAFPLMSPDGIDRIFNSLLSFRPAPQITQQFAEQIVADALKKKLTPARVPTRSTLGLTPPAGSPASK